MGAAIAYGVDILAERVTLTRRRQALLSSLEQSLVAGLDGLRKLNLDSAQVSAAAERRFRFAVARHHDAATAATALPIPDWAA
jgi:hypothetical protein